MSNKPLAAAAAVAAAAILKDRQQKRDHENDSYAKSHV
jgi:hypothetical protein